MLTVMGSKKFQALQNEAKKPRLTGKGNEYKPTNFGTVAGLIGGAYAGYKITTLDSFASKAKAASQEFANAKGFKNNLIAGAKDLKHTAIAGAIIAGAAIIAARIGHALIDNTENKERRIQADGEAAKKAREAVTAEVE